MNKGGTSPDDSSLFFAAILARCYDACSTVYPPVMPGPDRASLTILLLDEEGNIFE